MDSSVVENVRPGTGRAVGVRSENLTPEGFSKGLLGGDLTGSLDGSLTCSMGGTAADGLGV